MSTWADDNTSVGPRARTRTHALLSAELRATIRRILTPLGVRADPLPRAPARDPTEEQVDFGFDADAA